MPTVSNATQPLFGGAKGNSIKSRENILLKLLKGTKAKLNFAEYHR